MGLCIIAEGQSVLERDRVFLRRTQCSCSGIGVFAVGKCIIAVGQSVLAVGLYIGLEGQNVLAVGLCIIAVEQSVLAVGF